MGEGDVYGRDRELMVMIWAKENGDLRVVIRMKEWGTERLKRTAQWMEMEGRRWIERKRAS